MPQPALSPQTKTTDSCTRRLQDIVQRIGHLCLSPSLAHAMVCPTEARDALAGGASLPPSLALACTDKAGLLRRMSSDGTDTLAAKRYLHDARNIEAPARSIALKATQHLLAWRIEGPRRVVLFTGTHAEAASDPADMAPHLLAKTLLPQASRRPDLGEARLCTLAPPTEADVRARILHAGQTALGTGFLERVATHRKRSAALAHSLEEAVLAFSRPPPAECHARHIGLQQTPRWDKNHIDTRWVFTCLLSEGVHAMA